MKTHIFILVVLASLLFAQCKKETVTSMPDAKTTFLLQAQQFVQQKTSPADYGQLDWERAKVYQQNGVNQMVRVPLLGKTHPWQRAVYLTYANGSFSGNYFELVNNTITTVSLDKERECVAPLSADGRLGGYRVYEKGQLIAQNTAMRNAVYIIRPPVIIYDMNYGLYYLIETLGLGQGGNGEMGNAPSSTVNYLGAIPDGGELGGDGGGGEIIEIEYIDIDSKQAVDIAKLFKCFDELPNLLNTEYEITLNVDVPVNSIPMASYDLLYHPGHAFITITKRSGVASVTQSFGFYPVSGMSSVLNSVTSSKIVNDEWHEVNAKIKIPITQTGFNSVKEKAIALSAQPYSLENNNCADFAVQLFNTVRPGSPIVLPPFLAYADVPPVVLSFVMKNAPQTLFAWMKAKKMANEPEAPYITFDQTPNAASGPSQGECN